MDLDCLQNCTVQETNTGHVKGHFGNYHPIHHLSWHKSDIIYRYRVRFWRNNKIRLTAQDQTCENQLNEPSREHWVNTTYRNRFFSCWRRRHALFCLHLTSTRHKRNLHTHTETVNLFSVCSLHLICWRQMSSLEIKVKWLPFICYSSIVKGKV